MFVELRSRGLLIDRGFSQKVSVLELTRIYISREQIKCY